MPRDETGAPPIAAPPTVPTARPAAVRRYTSRYLGRPTVGVGSRSEPRPAELVAGIVEAKGSREDRLHRNPGRPDRGRPNSRAGPRGGHAGPRAFGPDPRGRHRPVRG